MRRVYIALADVLHYLTRAAVVAFQVFVFVPTLALFGTLALTSLVGTGLTYVGLQGCRGIARVWNDIAAW